MSEINEFSLRNEIVNFLSSHKNCEYTARELARYIADNFEEAMYKKIQNSKNTKLKTKEDCIDQWCAEIATNKQYWEKQGICISGKPKRYSILEKTSVETETKKIDETDKITFSEKELYPILAKFCKAHNIETLRINEKTSKSLKSGGNVWLHADVVGFQDLTKSFKEETKECLIEYSDKRSYLYSFEVKLGTIKSGDLRKNFFQTVSNSSWANFSYLVAEGIDEEALSELQLLCSSFNIGFIQINRANPLESKFLIKAPETELDWNMMNRIASVNSDFSKFLNNITLSYKGHSDPFIAKPEWDIPDK